MRLLSAARAGEVVWLLTNTKRLIEFSVPRRSSTAVAVEGFREDDEVWGLASSGEGTLWTLLTPSLVAEVRTNGTVGRRIPLTRQYLGLHGSPGGLLVQPVNVLAGRQILESVQRPGETGRAVGSLRVVKFATRAETLARNLVGCGLSRTTEVPCWVNHDPRVHRIGADGTGRVIELGDALMQRRGRRVRPLDEPGPVIDAQIGHDGALWVLFRPVGEGRELEIARYAPDGVRTHHHQLERDVRFILDVAGTRCLLLARAGEPIEVAVG